MMVRSYTKTIQDLASSLTNELSNAGSLFRTGCWTLFFLIIILCAASHPHKSHTKLDGPAPGNGFLKVLRDSYEPLDEPEATPNVFRVAVIGSSEAFDFLEHKYSLGASIFRLAPRYTSAKIEVIEKTQIDLSRRQKMQAVQQAGAYDADLIVVSLPLFQLLKPPEIGEFEAPLLDTLLAIARTPSGSLDRAFSAVRPGYRANLARAFHLAPPPAHHATSEATRNEENVIATHVPPPRDSTATRPRAALDTTSEDHKANLEWNHDMLDELAQYGHVRSQAVAYVLEELVKPAVKDGIPVVILASPVETSLLGDKSLGLVREDEQTFDNIASQFNGTSVILFDGLRLGPAEANDFLDFVHLDDHDPLASALLDYLTEKGVIPRNESKAEN